MLRCGLRVEEVADLTLSALDLNRSRLFVYEGKGGKGRGVYLSQDAKSALTEYLQVRPICRTKRIFLAEEKNHRGQPLSVRGIQPSGQCIPQNRFWPDIRRKTDNIHGSNGLPAHCVDIA